jgi:hypothetical protein
MGRSIEDSFAIREKVSTSGLSLSSAYQSYITSILIHKEDLVTLESIPGRLKNELLPIKGEVSFCILPLERDLPEVSKVLFLWIMKRLPLALDTRDDNKA